MLLRVTGSPGSRGGARCFLTLLIPSLTSTLPPVQAQEGESREGEGRAPGKAKRTWKAVDREMWKGGGKKEGKGGKEERREGGCVREKRTEERIIRKGI